MRVMIIGAGVIGVTTAWFLLRRGHQVTLLDRRGTTGQETSYANGGLLHASHAEPWNAPGVLWRLLRWIGREDSPLLLRPRAIPGLTRWGLGFLRYSTRRHHERGIRLNTALAVHSLAVLRELRRDTGIRYDDRQNGILKIFRDPRDMEHALHNTSLMGEAGLRYSVLDARQAVALEPALGETSDELTGAIHYPDDESGDAHLFTRRLAALLEQKGAAMELDNPVHRIVRQGKRIIALETEHGRRSADCYVLAAGSYSPLLARTAGLRLPVYPVKGYSVTVPADGWAGAPAIPLIDDSNKVVLSILGNRVRMAGTAEFAGFDTSLSEARARSVLRQCLKTFPSLEAQATPEATELWCGLRPMTMDGPPILGASGLDGLYLNCGSGHLGWTLACGAGQLVADLVDDRPPALDPAGYSLRRY